MMPVMNGVDLAIQFKAIWPKVGVLLFSGVLMSDLLRENAKANGHHFDMLAKSIHPKAMLAAIEVLGR